MWLVTTTLLLITLVMVASLHLRQCPAPPDHCQCLTQPASALAGEVVQLRNEVAQPHQAMVPSALEQLVGVVSQAATVHMMADKGGDWLSRLPDLRAKAPTVLTLFGSLGRAANGQTWHGQVSQQLSELLRSLLRNAPPPEGAVPVTPPQMMLVINQARTEMEKCQLRLQLLSASRSNDMLRLETRDVGVVPNFAGAADSEQLDAVVLRWRTTKSGPRPMAVIIPLPAADTAALQENLRTVPRGSKPFQLLDAKKVGDRLQLVQPDLTLHSIKKGALRALLEVGRPVEQVAFKAKRVDERLLQDYVGPETWATAHKAHEMSASLDAMLVGRLAEPEFLE